MNCFNYLEFIESESRLINEYIYTYVTLYIIERKKMIIQIGEM